MPLRLEEFVDEGIYHVYTRSIEKYEIFKSEEDYERMHGAIAYYSRKEVPCPYSAYRKLIGTKNQKELSPLRGVEKQVGLLAFCLMPTHLHFIIKQISKHGISKFCNILLTSYSKYFNSKYDRKGPLWEGRFKSGLIKTEDQLLHLTRYVHLNPSSAGLVENPKDWKYSSYREYLGKVPEDDKICFLDNLFGMTVKEYEKYVVDRVGDQRELAILKSTAGVNPRG